MTQKVTVTTLPGYVYKKLATDYNTALTHDEEQRQLIFQVVEHIAGI